MYTLGVDTRSSVRPFGNSEEPEFLPASAGVADVCDSEARRALIRCCRFSSAWQAAGSRQQAAGNKQQAAGRVKQQEAGSKEQAAGSNEGKLALTLERLD